MSKVKLYYQKRKRGSTIVLVLVIGLAMTIIMSTMMSSAIYSSKLNNYEKNDDDLIYAAEGALELGLSKLKNENVTSATNVSVPELINEESVKEVRYSIISNGNIYTVTAEALNNNMKRSVIAKLDSKKITASNALENSMVSQDGISISTSSKHVDMSQTQVMIDDGSVGLPTKPGNGNGNNKIEGPQKINNETINLPEFSQNIKKINGTITINDKNIGNTNIYPSFGTEINLDGSTKVTNGIGWFNVNESAPNKSYRVVLVNADKLILDINGGGSADLNNLILICSGDIEIRCNGKIEIKYSTIFGNSITTTDNGQIDVIGAPNMGESPDNLTTQQNKVVNDVLNKYITNWSTCVDTTEVEGSSDFEINEIIYD